MCGISLRSEPADQGGCPFSFRQLSDNTFLIRENDRFGEYPHIYVRKVTQVTDRGDLASVVVINDTGAGTALSSAGTEWNIRTFIEQHLNCDNETPYLVILSHCHYDHILGLDTLLSAKPNASTQTTASKELATSTTILSSPAARSFAAPFDTLMEHSLSNMMGVAAPKYETTMWAADGDFVTYEHPQGRMRLPIITFVTPGHTPDSLSWYDTEERALYVGDLWYEEVSDDTRAAPWGPERAAPIIFPAEGNILDWWRSVERLYEFVKARNEEHGPRVTLAAGHVTAQADAENNLVAVKEFMSKVLREDIKFQDWAVKRGDRFGLWTDDGEPEGGRFRLAAPLRVLQAGREEIPETEWRSNHSLEGPAQPAN